MVTWLTYLFEIQCDGDPVVLLAICNAWTLPPAVATVDGVGDRMTQASIVRVTDSALDLLSHTLLHVLNETTELLRSALATRSIGRDLRVRCEVKRARTIN